MKIRALIADDQPLARERLLALLASEPDVEVVGVATTGVEAAHLVNTVAPDLVFLDMQMPEMDGIDVVEAVGVDRMPLTVFVTAYDQYAIRAFELHALDYLLKPFGRARFQRALGRARVQLERAQAGTLAAQLLAAVVELRRPTDSAGRVMLKLNGRVRFIDIDEIDWVEAEGNYVRIQVGEQSHVVRETLVQLQARLGERFFRIHRSRLVNLSRIKELRLGAGGDYDVILKNGVALTLSRLYRAALEERLLR
jgi:two-component system LytT family response regulator